MLEKAIRPIQKGIEKDFRRKRIKEYLQGTVSCLDFLYNCSLFLVANDKSISHLGNIQKGKLKKKPFNNFTKISE